ncbi:hypothetical protein SHKM778_55020 [Streptomyces sp. KM77-8]|uniref:Uncharacterized protein n=1 Tax=Streptomyces haneummycinicus TaxID=3074435 RepID=A0AAT9HPK1_9ACTN
MPRATYLAVVVVTGFFALTSWMLISAHGASHAAAAAGDALASGDSSGFVFAPIADQFGGWVNSVLPVLLATSLFAGILTFHNSANRYLFSLGRDGQLPAGLCRLNTRHAPGSRAASRPRSPSRSSSPSPWPARTRCCTSSPGSAASPSSR